MHRLTYATFEMRTPTRGKCQCLMVYSPSLHAISELQLQRRTAHASRDDGHHYPFQLYRN